MENRLLVRSIGLISLIAGLGMFFMSYYSWNLPETNAPVALVLGVIAVITGIRSAFFPRTVLRQKRNID